LFVQASTYGKRVLKHNSLNFLAVPSPHFVLLMAAAPEPVSEQKSHARKAWFGRSTTESVGDGWDTVKSLQSEQVQDVVN